MQSFQSRLRLAPPGDLLLFLDFWLPFLEFIDKLVRVIGSDYVFKLCFVNQGCLNI